MRVPRHTGRAPVAIPMTPMIDVVFLLVIFFLVSSHLARQETQMDLSLPEAATGEEETAEAAPRVTLNVTADGRVFWGMTAVTTDELKHRLIQRRMRAGKPIEVRIRGDQRVAYRVVEPVLRTCAEAGIADVAFAVLPAEGTR